MPKLLEALLLYLLWQRTLSDTWDDEPKQGGASKNEDL